MQPTKIEWCDLTWNPITGCSKLCRDEDGKIYCYAYYMARRLKGRFGYPKYDPFKVTFHKARLIEPLKREKPARIFTVSMGDLFDKNVKREWVHAILTVMRATPRHTFQILTKQPGNAFDYNFPSNCWVGISDDCQSENWSSVAHDHFGFIKADIKFISFEPLLGSVFDSSVIEGVDWVIIGAKTGARARQPKREWVEEILKEADAFHLPVFMKDNLEWPEGEKRQEFPERCCEKSIQKLLTRGNT